MIDNNDIKELIEQDAEESWIIVFSGIFLACSLFVAIHSAYKIFSILVDDSVPLVTCPDAYDLDSPVILKSIRESDIKNKDRWVRGFIRRYVTRQFPRTKEDAIPFISYVAAHSKGSVKRKYDGFLDDKEDFQNLIDNNFLYKFYPKNSSDIRIRSTDSPGTWVVEIDGYMVKRISHLEERTTPTLRYTVEAGRPTMENPEGLYVTESNTEVILDYVSGRKKE